MTFETKETHDARIEDMKQRIEAMKTNIAPIQITEEDMHNIYDLICMIEYGNLKLNGMDKWASEFFEKIEPFVLGEKEE